MNMTNKCNNFKLGDYNLTAKHWYGDLVLDKNTLKEYTVVGVEFRLIEDGYIVYSLLSEEQKFLTLFEHNILSKEDHAQQIELTAKGLIKEFNELSQMYVNLTGKELILENQ